MKSNAVVRIVLWSLIATTLIGLLIGFMFNNDFKFSFDTNLKVIKTTEVDASNIDSINLKGLSNEFSVKSYEGNKIVVTEKANRDLDNDELLKINHDDNTLTLEQRFHIDFFNIFDIRIIKYEIQIPNKLYKQITAKITSGKLEMNNINSKTLNLKMTSGKSDLDNVNSNKVLIDITSGKAILNGKFLEIKAVMTSGSIDIDSDIAPNKMIIGITSGNANITIPDNDGFILSEHKTSGSINTDFNLNDFGKYKNGLREYSVKLTSGSFHLLKK